MYHSVTFGDKNTWDDYHLIPLTRPVFNPPTQKTNLIDIPGADGSLDLSNALTGYPVYDNRQGSMEFAVDNDFKEWTVAFSDILNHVHGRTLDVFLEDDPNFIYKGRFAVNVWKSDKDRSSIVIDYVVNPYKVSKLSSIEDETQKEYFNNISIDSDVKMEKTFVGLIGRMPVCPTFVVSTTNAVGMDIRFVNDELGIDVESHFSDGDTINPDFIFTNLSPTNTNKLYISGHGTLSIVFKSGGF